MDTKYARNGDIHIAYQVIGTGSVDLLFVPGWYSHVEIGWEMPAYARFLERLASFSRLIVLDKRGTGASDRSVPSLALEEQLDDVGSVLDAAGSERPFLFGSNDGGALSLLFAATYPQRARAVITLGTVARMMAADDYPMGRSEEWMSTMSDLIEAAWGDVEANAALARLTNPSADDALIEWAIKWSRAASSPGTNLAILDMYRSIDLRPVLPSVGVPVLVLHRSHDLIVEPEQGRYLAAHLPDARFVEVPGADFFPVGELDPIADEIQEFVTGTRAVFDPDRVFATILFTDFVDSTKQSAQLGDRAWRDLLNRHDDIAHRQLDRFRGRWLKQTGDGLVASFDGPGRAIRCAVAIREAVSGLGLTIRGGLHAGEVEIRGQDLSGIAMSIGSRVMALAAAGEILVSSTVKDLVAGSGIAFSDRGTHALKGVPGEWRLYEVA